MENQGGERNAGDIKSLRDVYGFPQKHKHSIVVAGEMEDCFFLEMIIRQIAPNKKILPMTSSHEMMTLLQYLMPELLIMDLEMPCGKGIECLARIRDNPVYQDLEIVVFSKNTRPSNKTVAMELGANHYLHLLSNLTLLRKS